VVSMRPLEMASWNILQWNDHYSRTLRKPLLSDSLPTIYVTDWLTD
jgi:hypothetical protein